MIGILIFPEFQILDAAGPIAALEMASRREPRFLEVRTIADGSGPVRSSSGVMMHAHDLRSVSVLSTLIVTGGDGVYEALENRTILEFVQTMYERGARVASVCSGAYILAEAGLLEGRRATTHWLLTADFNARFPGVKLMPDQIYTSDGPVWTSAGISAGIDLALAMVAADYGDRLAQDAARQLVLYHRRAGGQSQFSTLLEMKTQSGRFATLLLWIRDHLHLPLTVEILSAQAGMSARHFARVFAAEVGTSPSKAVERLRIEVARERVQFSAEPIEHIATAVGFGDPERMRRAFIRVFGQSPQTVRRMARG